MAAESFETYADRMKFWRDRVVARRASRHHPFLGKDDLAQVALMTLWEVWQKHGGALPAEELQRLGTTAMLRRVQSECRRSGYFGANRVVLISLGGGSVPDTRAHFGATPDPVDLYLRDKGDKGEWPMKVGLRRSGRTHRRMWLAGRDAASPRPRRPRKSRAKVDSIPESQP